MRPVRLFPVDLCCGWGQSTDPSVLFRVVQYYSVWLNDYPLLCHQRIFMTIEGRLSSWRRDNAWLSAARQRVPFRGHTNVFHTPTDTTTFLDKEEDDGTQMRERNGLRELGYVGVFLPFGVFSSWISMSDLLETSLGLKCFFSCSTHTKLFWVVLFVFVYNAAEIGWLDIFKIENWCLLREWEEERRTLLAGNMGHTKDNLLLWRLCWIWGGGFGGSWYGGKSSAASPWVPNPLMVLQMLDPNGSCTTATYLFLFIY